jgi:hypothetical protein
MWANGAADISGVISSENSLVGSQTGDEVGGGIRNTEPSVVEVGDSNYLALSAYWRDGPTWKVGAVTWGNGEQGIVGPVSAQNSLIGTQENDYVGGIDYAPGESVRILPGGNYVLSSPSWDNGSAVDAGALTWGSGNHPLVGRVSADNSLVGSQTRDRVGWSSSWEKQKALVVVSGDLLVPLAGWDNGDAVDAGTVALIHNGGGPVGIVSCENSLCGTTPGGGQRMRFSQHPARYEVAVGMPADNRVVLLQLPSPRAWLPVLLR